jgi:thymidylate synthase ThyX
MISAEILLDSINPVGNRITSWVLTYPRFFHSELMTHRVFSRNAASSRAIPVKKMIDQIKNNSAMPIFWGKNQSGMQAAEELDDTILEHTVINPVDGTEKKVSAKHAAKHEWLAARDSAVKHAEKMLEIGLHKQIANRITEPFMNMKIILTGTEFQNFFSLRAHSDTQPEFQDLAYKMLSLYQSNKPNTLKHGEWHIPFGNKLDLTRLMELYTKNTGKHYNGQPDPAMDDLKLKIATARCARVSYSNFEGKDDYDADLELSNRLSDSGHWSPFEHCAQSMNSSDWYGNFKGWKQYRKFFNMENRKDDRAHCSN